MLLDDQLQNLMTVTGNKKIYKDVTKTSTGKGYCWDMNFVGVFNNFCMQIRDFRISKSDKVNIDLFASYADGEIDQNNKEHNSLQEFDKYLGSL